MKRVESRFPRVIVFDYWSHTAATRGSLMDPAAAFVFPHVYVVNL